MTSREILSRRNFLRRASGLMAGGTVANALLDLRLINNAMATINVADYKALVCVFMAGGNDCNNLLIPAPTDPRYAGYKATRGARLALWEDATAAAARADQANNPNSYYARPLSNANTVGDYAVHSGMPAVQTLFNAGKLAFVSNVGVMVEPATKAQIAAKTRKLPPQLFSHNDQVTQWQTSIPDAISRVGWGGTTADKIRAELVNLSIPTGSISMSVSLAGSNTWEVGNAVSQFQVSTSGAVNFQLYSTRQSVIDAILRDPASGGNASLGAARTNLNLKDYQKVNERAIYNGASLSTALTRLVSGPAADIGYGTAIDTAFGIGTGGVTYANLSSLEQQLHTVARIIAERDYLQMRRQIFFVQLGGHDTHGDQPVAHNNLVATTSRALGKFYDATNALTIANKVTAFTASDFGRTFKSNGLGSDHAWGSHHMVVGGAVNGGRLYGTYPTLQLNGPDDYDTGSGATGRWIPSLSVDEYSATLARWFGLDTAALNSVFPNLSRFPSSNLGFLA